MLSATVCYIYSKLYCIYSKWWQFILSSLHQIVTVHHLTRSSLPNVGQLILMSFKDQFAWQHQLLYVSTSHNCVICPGYNGYCWLSCILNKCYTSTMKIAVVSFTYPMVIFDVDISHLLNKLTDCFNIATASCPE